MARLNASAGSWAILAPAGGQLPGRAIDMHGHRWSALAFGVLGLTTCLTVIEPAPYELIALTLVLASAVRHLLSGSRPYTPSSAALVLLLALFSLLQFLPVLGFARDVLHAAQYATVTAILIVIGTYLGFLFGNGDARFRTFTRFYCVAALLSAVIAVVSLQVNVSQMVPEWFFYAGRPKVFFKDPNVLGPYLVPAVLVFLYQATRSRFTSQIFYVCCALLCALGVIATASRGAWVNLAVVVAVYTVLGRTKAHAIVLFLVVTSLFLALAAIAGAISTSAPELLDLFVGRTQLQEYDAQRFTAAQQAWELGMRYPLGVGPGDITKYMGIAPMDPHNTYVRVWAENGPAALLLFIIILGLASGCAFLAWLNTRGGARDEMAAALALLMGLLANAAVVDALHWRHFWVILGLCIFSSHSWRRR